MRENQVVKTPPTNPASAERKTGLAGVVEKVPHKARAFLLGYDLFISYRRADANDYALRLANRLTKRGFRCYLDQFSSPADQNLPGEVKDALRHSTGLVLVGSPGALESKAIMEEVTIFSTLSRTIIPVSIARTLNDSAWGGRIAGISRTEETVQALQDGNPSRQVIIRIVDSASFRRRNDQLKRTFFGLLAVVLLIILAGTAAAVLLGQKATAAGRQAQDAERKRTEAVSLAQAAERQRKDIEGSLTKTREELDQKLEDLRLTGEELKTAQLSTRIAQGHEQAARARAEEQRLIAEARRREAERLGRVAESRSLLAQAESLRTADPATWAEPVDLAVKAYDIYPSAEPSSLLRYGLRRLARPLVCITSEGSVNYLTYSAAGDRLYTANSNGEIRVLDATLGASAGKDIESRTLERNLRNAVGTTARVPGGDPRRVGPRIVKLSADGRFAAAIYPHLSDRDLLEVSANDGTGVKMTVEVETKLVSIDISADGSHVAATNGRRVQVWKTGNTMPVLDVTGDDQGLGQITLSPKGSYVAASSDKFENIGKYGLRLWSTETKESLLPQPRREGEEAAPEEGFVHTVAFSPSEEHLAFAVRSTEVHIYGIEKRAYVQSFDDVSSITALTSYTMKVQEGSVDILAIGYDISPVFGLVRFYVMGAEKEQRHIDEFNLWHTSPVEKIVFATDNKSIFGIHLLTVTADNTVHLWELGTGQKKILTEVTRINHDSPVSAVALAFPQWSHGPAIATASEGRIRMWEGPSDALTPFMYVGEIGASISWGRRFATITGYGRSWLVNTMTGEMKPTEFGDQDDAVAVAHDGKRLLSLSSPYTLKDMTTGAETSLPESLSLMIFSPDLRYVAVNDKKNRTSIWKMDGDTAAEFLPLGEDVTKVVFSPDGEHFAVVREDSKDLQVGSFKEVRRAGAGYLDFKVLQHSLPVDDIVYSRYGKYLAVTSGWRVTLWSDAGLQLNKMGCESGIRGVAFSENEKRFAVICEGGEVQVYETSKKRAPLAVFTEREDAELLAFDSSGEHLAVAVKSGRLRAIDVEENVDNKVWIWSVQGGSSKEPTSRIEFETGIRMFFFSPGDSRYLVALLQDRFTLTPWRTSDLLSEAKARLSPDKNCPQ